MRKRSAPAPPAQSRRATPHRTPGDDVRASAAWVVERTLASLAPVDSYLATVLGRYDERDRALLSELVLGTLRWLRRLDHVLEAAASRPLSEVEPALHATLRIAAYQLLFLDRVPAHAAVNEAVEQARGLTHRGGTSFVNAVLRRIARDPQLAAWPIEERDPVRRMAIEGSHPDFLVRRWSERFGHRETERLLAANNRPKPLHLLAFRDRGGRELLAERLIDEGVEVVPSRLSPLGLVVRAGNPLSGAAFQRGDFYVQDEASQIAAWLPPPRPGERIWDAAAAPGGKSLALSAREPSVRLTAGDVSLDRLRTFSANLTRLNRRMPLVVADAGAPPFAERFDRVVLDLPCAGTGTLRKHPELKWRLSEDEIGRLAAQGARMLAGTAPLVVPGGLLVAITCSLEAEENEEVIQRFLAKERDFEPFDFAGALPAPLDREVRGPGFWRIFPGDEHDGFSVSVLRRRG